MEEFNINDWTHKFNRGKFLKESPQTNTELLYNHMLSWFEQQANKGGQRFEIARDVWKEYGNMIQYQIIAAELGRSLNSDTSESVTEGTNDSPQIIEIIYIDGAQTFYKTYVTDQNGQRNPIRSMEETNDYLHSLGIQSDIPKHYDWDELEKLAMQLRDLGIEVHHSDAFDVS